MENTNTELLSRHQLQLQIELIINRKLFDKNKIMKDLYSKTENRILREIESEKKHEIRFYLHHGSHGKGCPGFGCLGRRMGA